MWTLKGIRLATIWMQSGFGELEHELAWGFFREEKGCPLLGGALADLLEEKSFSVAAAIIRDQIKQH